MAEWLSRNFDAHPIVVCVLGLPIVLTMCVIILVLVGSILGIEVQWRRE